MVVLFQHGGLFKLGVVCSELVLGYQVAIKQKFNGVIKGGPAYPVFMILHSDIKGLDIKMTFRCKNFPENGISLRCFAMAVSFKIIGENFPYIFEGIFRRFFNHNHKFGSKIQFYYYLEQIKIDFLINSCYMHYSIYILEFCQSVIQDGSILYIHGYCSLRQAIVGFNKK